MLLDTQSNDLSIFDGHIKRVRYFLRLTICYALILSIVISCYSNLVSMLSSGLSCAWLAHQNSIFSMYEQSLCFTPKNNLN
jgi:hypothetical protein